MLPLLPTGVCLAQAARCRVHAFRLVHDSHAAHFSLRATIVAVLLFLLLADKRRVLRVKPERNWHCTDGKVKPTKFTRGVVCGLSLNCSLGSVFWIVVRGGGHWPHRHLLWAFKQRYSSCHKACWGWLVFMGSRQTDIRTSGLFITIFF